MDTILLMIGVVGLSVSGWVLRGYYINTPSALPPEDKQPNGSSKSPRVADQEKPISYVTSEEHQQVIARIAELEKGGYSPKVEENGSATPLETVARQEPATNGSLAHQEQLNDEVSNEPERSEAWHEIYALQQAYRLEREKESEIDYQQEQVLFDLSQGYDGRFAADSTESKLTEEDKLNLRLLDNQLEDGEELEVYQERMNALATLTKEVLITRLDAYNQQLREQQERHQAALLTIISTLIERMPGDVNLTGVVQSSYVEIGRAHV